MNKLVHIVLSFIIAVWCYFLFRQDFDGMVQKQIESIEKWELSALYNKKQTLQLQLSWIDSEIQKKQIKLQNLKNLNDSKPILEEKTTKENTKTPTLSRCVDPDGVLTIKSDYYENYTFYGEGVFAWYNWHYRQWELKCLLFKDKADMDYQLWE